ncbi:hypothetical protein LTR08_003690 [Meristemomyces frigidus]|nr:hypothetical protein LTR08_003690 [Meristemomyces frigidus]
MPEIAECCRKGFKWNATPTGREGTLAQNQAYITGTNKNAAVLVIHDIYGWTFSNIRLLADRFAEECNATVYVPDFFGGQVLPEDDIDETLKNPARKLIDIPGFFAANSKQIRQPEIFSCARALRAQHAKVGAVGYCFGGWACFRLGAKELHLVDCISVAHPSLLEKSEIDNLSVPTQIIAPEHDYLLTPELKEYCNTTIPRLGVAYQYDFYPGLEHGFAVRGDPEDVRTKVGLERAKNAVVMWFNEHLA